MNRPRQDIARGLIEEQRVHNLLEQVVPKRRVLAHDLIQSQHRRRLSRPIQIIIRRQLIDAVRTLAHRLFIYASTSSFPSLPYASNPITTNRIKLMNPSGAMRLSVSIWLVNRISMNVNAAFSSFCRFYASLSFSDSTSIWKNGMRSTIVMHASSVCCRQLSLYSTNTPNGTYFPAIPHSPFLPLLSILFSACSTNRAHVNTPSGASDYASFPRFSPTKSWYDAIRSWMYSQRITAVFLKSVMPLVLVLPESTRESSFDLRCRRRNRGTRRTPGSGASRCTPRRSRGTSRPSSASPRITTPIYSRILPFFFIQCLEENSIRSRIRAGIAHAPQILKQLHQLHLHRTGSPRNTVTFPCEKSCCCSSCNIDKKGARNISKRPGTLSSSTRRVSEA